MDSFDLQILNNNYKRDDSIQIFLNSKIENPELLPRDEKATSPLKVKLATIDEYNLHSAKFNDKNANYLNKGSIETKNSINVEEKINNIQTIENVIPFFFINRSINDIPYDETVVKKVKQKNKSPEKISIRFFDDNQHYFERLRIPLKEKSKNDKNKIVPPDSKQISLNDNKGTEDSKLIKQKTKSISPTKGSKQCLENFPNQISKFNNKKSKQNNSQHEIINSNSKNEQDKKMLSLQVNSKILSGKVAKDCFFSEKNKNQTKSRRFMNDINSNYSSRYADIVTYSEINKVKNDVLCMKETEKLLDNKFKSEIFKDKKENSLIKIIDKTESFNITVPLLVFNKKQESANIFDLDKLKIEANEIQLQGSKTNVNFIKSKCSEFEVLKSTSDLKIDNQKIDENLRDNNLSSKIFIVKSHRLFCSSLDNKRIGNEVFDDSIRKTKENNLKEELQHQNKLIDLRIAGNLTKIEPSKSLLENLIENCYNEVTYNLILSLCSIK